MGHTANEADRVAAERRDVRKTSVGCVLANKPRHTLVVSAVVEDEFTVAGHNFCHLALGVDNGWSGETSGDVGSHVDVTVVRPETAVLALCWSLGASDDPLVDGATSWRNSILFLDLWRSSSGGVWVQGALVLFAVVQTHGVHTGIVLREVVNEQNLDHVVDFSTKSWTVKTGTLILLGLLSESCISVAPVGGLLPCKTTVLADGSRDVEVTTSGGSRGLSDWHTEPVVPGSVLASRLNWLERLDHAHHPEGA